MWLGVNKDVPTVCVLLLDWGGVHSAGHWPRLVGILRQQRGVLTASGDAVRCRCPTHSTTAVLLHHPHEAIL